MMGCSVCKRLLWVVVIQVVEHASPPGSHQLVLQATGAMARIHFSKRTNRIFGQGDIGTI